MNKFIIVTGGFGGQSGDKVEYYDTFADEWSNLPELN